MTEPTIQSSCTYTEQTTHHDWRCRMAPDHPGQHVLRAIRCDLPTPCLLTGQDVDPDTTEGIRIRP